MCMTNVICHLPVRCTWCVGLWRDKAVALPWSIDMTCQWYPVFKRDFQNFFSRSLLPRSLSVTGLPDPLLYHLLKALGLEYWERSSLQRLQETQPNPIFFSEGYVNTFFNSQKWLWYQTFAMLRSLNAQCTENIFFGCINHRIWEYY